MVDLKPNNRIGIDSYHKPIFCNINFLPEARAKEFTDLNLVSVEDFDYQEAESEPIREIVKNIFCGNDVALNVKDQCAANSKYIKYRTFYSNHSWYIRIEDFNVVYSYFKDNDGLSIAFRNLFNLNPPIVARTTEEVDDSYSYPSWMTDETEQKTDDRTIINVSGSIQKNGRVVWKAKIENGTDIQTGTIIAPIPESIQIGMLYRATITSNQTRNHQFSELAPVFSPCSDSTLPGGDENYPLQDPSNLLWDARETGCQT